MMMYVDESRKNEWILQGKTMQHALRISGKGNITPFRMLPKDFVTTSPETMKECHALMANWVRLP